MGTSDAMKERAPALTKDLKDLLQRMERPDLAAQMDAFRIRSEERSRRDRRRTFFADTAAQILAGARFARLHRHPGYR